MKKKIHFVILVLSLVILLTSLYGIVNTMISLKYETENAGDCISRVSGDDLCQTITILKIISGISGLVLIAYGYVWAFKKSQPAANTR